MSAESRPDCPDGVLEAMEPSIFTPRTKRSTLTPGGGSRSVSGHFPAAGEAAGTAGRPWPAPSPGPDAFALPPPQATATRATTTNTRRRGDRIIRMGPRYCTDPGSSTPLCGACAGSACSQLLRRARAGTRCTMWPAWPGSVLDEPEGHLPVEGAEALAVPGPAGAPGPGARQGAGHPVHTLQMFPADPALLCRSAAGVPAVGGPDTAPGAAACPPADC